MTLYSTETRTWAWPLVPITLATIADQTYTVGSSALTFNHNGANDFSTSCSD